MIILTTDKKYWIDKGWTIGELEKRLSDCRKYQREYRNFPESSRFTYRLLNSNLYRKYKFLLNILKK